MKPRASFLQCRHKYSTSARNHTVVIKLNHGLSDMICAFLTTYFLRLGEQRQARHWKLQHVSMNRHTAQSNYFEEFDSPTTRDTTCSPFMFPCEMSYTIFTLAPSTKRRTLTVSERLPPFPLPVVFVFARGYRCDLGNVLDIFRIPQEPFHAD